MMKPIAGMRCKPVITGKTTGKTTGKQPVGTVVGMRPAGFSLIELMIVVAIIGILIAIAIPSYKQYILSGKQGAAKAVLLDIAQKQPQFLADRRSTYARCLSSTYLYGGVTAADCTTEHLSLTVPPEVAALYGFSITLSGPPPGYTAVATPISSEVGTTSFHIDHSGKRLKGVNGVAGTQTW